MPDIPIINIEVEQFRTKKQEALLKLLNDPEIKTNINTRIKDAINEFVPKNTGALRASARATPDYISWGENLPQYARYQYYGEVYGPNLPGLDGGIPAWRSFAGRRKYPTGRELGKFGFARLYPKWSKDSRVPSTPIIYGFGYHTPGTHHHWDKYFRYLPKMKTNLEITRYLRKKCKEKGLKA